VLGRFDASGACQSVKLLSLPTAAVKAMNFRLGADGSMLAAVVYAGTIDFGGGPLTSSGTNALAIAGFDNLGNFLWSRSVGSASSAFTIGSIAASAAGTVILTGGYSGAVDLGGGPLPASDDTFLATFDANNQYKWGRTVAVGSSYRLVAAAAKCGFVVATNSPTVDLGNGPVAAIQNGVAGIGVAVLGL
jgi:hypothetical protein